MRYRMCFLPLFAVACWLASARAGDFVSPEGFTLAYPEKWTIASKEQFDKVVELTKKSTGSDQGMVAVIYGPQSENFTPNITVIIPQVRYILNPADENQMVKEIKTALTAPGGAAPVIKTVQFRIDGHTAFSLAFEQDNPAIKAILRTWMVILPGKKGATILRCTALKSQWGEAGPAFKSAIKGIKFDGVPTK